MRMFHGSADRRSSVYLPPVPHADDLNETSVVMHFVDDAVVADPDSVDRPLTGQGDAPWWTGRLRQQFDSRPHPLLFRAG